MAHLCQKKPCYRRNGVAAGIRVTGVPGHKKRNTVERAVNRLKQSRAIALRYDKRGYAFLGTATAASAAICP